MKFSTDELHEIIERNDIILTIFIDARAKTAIVFKPNLDVSVRSRLLFEVGKQLCDENAPVEIKNATNSSK